MVLGKIGGGTKSKQKSQRMKFKLTIQTDERENKITVAPSARVAHIKVESRTQVVFRSLESWSAIPDTQTLPVPTSGQVFQLSRIARAADRAEIFRRELHTGIREYAGAYNTLQDP